MHVSKRFSYRVISQNFILSNNPKFLAFFKTNCTENSPMMKKTCCHFLFIQTQNKNRIPLTQKGLDQIEIICFQITTLHSFRSDIPFQVNQKSVFKKIKFLLATKPCIYFHRNLFLEKV